MSKRESQDLFDKLRICYPYCSSSSFFDLFVVVRRTRKLRFPWNPGKPPDELISHLPTISHVSLKNKFRSLIIGSRQSIMSVLWSQSLLLPLTALLLRSLYSHYTPSSLPTHHPRQPPPQPPHQQMPPASSFQPPKQPASPSCLELLPRLLVLVLPQL